jgi:tetratricopeptide (TPR) repeat protein
MAIFNRGILLDRTGNLRGAIRDYSSVIAQFPNFWTGLSYRARCYRKLGMNAKAELDEFRIMKAQMNKHLGIQPRWSKHTLKAMRRRTEIDPDKYDQVVVEEADENMANEYKSQYRGKVQNQESDDKIMPMYELSFQPYNNGVRSYQAYSSKVEAFNQKMGGKAERVLVSCNADNLSAEKSKAYFKKVETLSASIAATKTVAEAKDLLLQRAITYSVLSDYLDAVSDLTSYIQIDSTNALAYWQRGVCQTMVNDFNASRGIDTKLKAAAALNDFSDAIRLDSDNAYIYYDRGNLHAALKDYAKAVDDYTKALSKDKMLAEAYYNRGVVRLRMGNKSAGNADLSKAGELGLYKAYSVIKHSKK